jgi:tripartite-type tricarboxylate transporter receptor subunit TctC
MKNPPRRSVISHLLAAFLLLTTAATGSLAQGFPDRAVKIIVPFPPGGATDIAARLVGERLSVTWGQPVVVENRSGASGSIGTDAVARAKADGYTILVGTFATNVMAHLLQAKVPYSRDAFDPVILLTSSPNILMTNQKLQLKSLDELVAHAKANPDKISYSSSGTGLSGHLGVELFADRAGLKLVHVPYRGSAPSGQALVQGEVDLSLALVAQAISIIEAKPEIRPLAIAAAQRSAQFPNVPTFAELGYPSVQVYAINGLMVPKGTPQPIIEKIYKDTLDILQDPKMREKMQLLGLDVAAASPQEFGKLLEDEFTRWEPLIRSNKITVN